jgi:uncharacterized protein YbjT (DUF2867 family)
VIAGAPRFAHTNQLRADRALQALLGMRRLSKRRHDIELFSALQSGRDRTLLAAVVAEVVTTLLTTPTAHINKVYELTGPRTRDMHALAAEYSDALRPALLADQSPLTVAF